VRVYTAWWSEADQRPAGATPTRLPSRPVSSDKPAEKTNLRLPNASDDDLQPYERIAADLRGAIDAGILRVGDSLPAEKVLATRYGVAPSTAHRAVALLVAAGLVSAARGRRATVAGGNGLPIASVTEIH
jgi:integrase